MLLSQILIGCAALIHENCGEYCKLIGWYWNSWWEANLHMNNPQLTAFTVYKIQEEAFIILNILFC